MTYLKRTFLAAAAVTLGAALFYFYGGHATPAGQPPLSELTRANFAATLKDAFNASAREARILILLSPT